MLHTQRIPHATLASENESGAVPSTDSPRETSKESTGHGGADTKTVPAPTGVSDNSNFLLESAENRNFATLIKSFFQRLWVVEKKKKKKEKKKKKKKKFLF
jgi:hypothetical protein